MNPIIFGIAFAVLGAAYHAVRVVRVVLGLAEPHSIGSLGFPLTASIVIGATAIVAFLVGLAFGVVWNWLTAATKLTRATWVIAILVIAAGAGFAAWALFLSPIKAPAATIQSDVAVEVFGLGTIEARVESKVGFKVVGHSRRSARRCRRSRPQGRCAGSPRRSRAGGAGRQGQGGRRTKRGQSSTGEGKRRQGQSEL